MAHIEELLKDVEPMQLRRQLEAEVAKLKEGTEFGLVFERHQPETTLVAATLELNIGDRVKDRTSPSSEPLTITSLAPRTVIVIDAEGDEHKLKRLDVMLCRGFDEPVFPTLRPDGSAGSPKADLSHLLIEGENFHVLETLLLTHRGKFDLIYIDPPYNTGSKDFRYNDRWVDSEDKHRSSLWLAFMERRLKIAWDLLGPNGVMLIQIGKDEVANLRLLGDKVLKYPNYVTTLSIHMSAVQGMKVGPARDGTIVKNAEFIHVWAKNARKNVGRIPLYDLAPYTVNYSVFLHPSGSGHFTEENLVDHLAKDLTVMADLAKNGVVEDLTSNPDEPRYAKLTKSQLPMAYERSPAFRAFVHAKSEQIVAVDKIGATAIPEDVRSSLREGATVRYDNGDRTYLIGVNSAGTVKQRTLLSEKIKVPADRDPEPRFTTLRGDWWPGYYRDLAQVNTQGGVKFENGKKPLRLLRDLVYFLAPQDGLILDFFAGSATTLHATAILNEEDGGTRRCFAVTNNEVDFKTTKELKKQGHFRGDPEFEKHGVYEAVAVQRCTNAIRECSGRQRVDFMRTIYLDPNRVEMLMENNELAPLMWLTAGAQGKPPKKLTADEGFVVDVKAGFAALIDEAKFANMLDALSETDKVTDVFLFTASQDAFTEMNGRLPGLTAHMWPSDYLKFFRSIPARRA